jgi:hypothetical protein
MISSFSLDKICLTVINIFIFGGACLVAAANDAEAIRASDRNREAMENYLGPVLTPLGGVGRVYIVTNCGANECPQFPQIRMLPASKGKTGLAAVREIFAKDKQTTVMSGPDGIIRVRIGAQPSTLLQTKIHYLRFKPLERYNIIEAEAAIEGAKEVKAAIKNLGLAEPVVVISELVQQPMEGVPHLPDHIENMTLEQALDLLATTFGEVVLYEECIRPNGTRCYFINHAYVQGGKWLDALRAGRDKLRTEGFNSGVCPVHQVPLQRLVVYGWSHSWKDAPPDPRPEYPLDEYFRREEKYPMCLSVNERLSSSRDFHTKKKTSERFCVKCQQLFEADLLRFSSQQLRRRSKFPKTSQIEPLP